MYLKCGKIVAACWPISRSGEGKREVKGEEGDTAGVAEIGGCLLHWLVDALVSSIAAVSIHSLSTLSSIF